jgi:hypothetical protein
MIWKSWTGFASIETTLEVLASSLPSVQGRMRSLFVEERSAMNAGLFLDGLLSEVRRKAGWCAQELARRVSLVMLAFAMTAAIRHQVNQPAPKNGSRRSQKPPDLIRQLRQSPARKWLQGIRQRARAGGRRQIGERVRHEFHAAYL